MKSLSDNDGQTPKVTLPFETIQEKVTELYKENNYEGVYYFLIDLALDEENEYYIQSELGRVLNNLERYQEALKYLLPVDRKEKGQNFLTKYRIAYSYCYLKDFDSAIEYGSKSQALDPENYNDFEAAVKYFKLYKEKAPIEDKYFACYWLAFLHKEQLKNNYEPALFKEALKYYNECLSIQANDGDVQAEIYELTELKKMYELALDRRRK